MWERVQRNGEKKEERYAFKVLLFSLSTEVETTTARNTEAVLLARVTGEGASFSIGGAALIFTVYHLFI